MPLSTIIALTLGSWALSLINWAEPAGPALNVSLVQADIALSEKWQPQNRQKIMRTYLSASREVDDADLIVWPEGALPMVRSEIPADYLAELKALGPKLIFGVVDQRESEGVREVYNSLALIDGEVVSLYRKLHLVPFGEFFPLQSVLGWLFESLQIPMSDFSSWGAPQANLSVDGVKLLPTICYEDAFPEDWRYKVRDAHVILNVSEDAWFGNSLGPHQRLQMARLRAIESARPLIRVSNNGLSTVIDARGQFDALSPQFEPALFSAPVTPMRGDTPYTRFGQWPLWLTLILCLGIAIWVDKRDINVH